MLVMLLTVRVLGSRISHQTEESFCEALFAP
jgi:hypothetical protein